MFGRFILGLVLLLAACAPRPDAELSPLAKSLLREHRQSWVFTEADPLRVYGATATLRHQVAAEATWMLTAIDEMLGLPPQMETGFVFVIDHEADWDRILRAAGARVEGAALHIGREIYLRRSAAGPAQWMDIPHELVHFRLWQTYGDRLPLWLEEGLAQYMGWELARQFQLERGLELERELPALAPEHLLPWEEVMQWRAYPASPEALTAFYRQSEELVAQWARMATPMQWREDIRRLIEEGETLRDTLITSYDDGEERYHSLLRRAETKVLQ